MSVLSQQVLENFEQTAKFVFVPADDEEFNQLVRLLDEITDIVRGDESHSLANWMEVLGALIESYEDEHFPEPAPDPVSVLKYFMEEHGLKQKDLPELGSQGVVSEILSGKRELNLRQIKALSKRFNVPVSVFV
jgi:HTH-type transcriptional regulator/antitoxin HigA